MKYLICGKGGSGKSTLAVLMARAFQRMGRRVLLVDADESNRALHRLAGTSSAETLLDALGGKEGLRARRKRLLPADACPAFYDTPFDWDDIPERCVPDADGIRLLKIGKIKAFREGCACPMGGVLRPFLAHFEAGGDDRMIVDLAAGVEHFGRGARMRAAAERMIDPDSIWAEIRDHEALFLAGLEGRPIDLALPEIDGLCRRLETLRRPLGP